MIKYKYYYNLRNSRRRYTNPDQIDDEDFDYDEENKNGEGSTSARPVNIKDEFKVDCKVEFRIKKNTLDFVINKHEE